MTNPTVDEEIRVLLAMYDAGIATADEIDDLIRLLCYVWKRSAQGVAMTNVTTAGDITITGVNVGGQS